MAIRRATCARRYWKSKRGIESSRGEISGEYGGDVGVRLVRARDAEAARVCPGFRGRPPSAHHVRSQLGGGRGRRGAWENPFVRCSARSVCLGIFRLVCARDVRTKSGDVFHGDRFSGHRPEFLCGDCIFVGNAERRTQRLHCVFIGDYVRLGGGHHADLWTAGVHASGGRRLGSEKCRGFRRANVRNDH